MKKLIIFLFTLSLSLASTAQQTKYTDPGAYMNDIQKWLVKIQQDMWDYTNAAAHGKSVRKIENKRQDIIGSLKDAKDFVYKMPSYKGDRSLKDSSLSYLRLSNKIMTQDISKLVNMEDIAEDSYDAMEAYLKAKDMVVARQDSSLEMVNNEFKNFAKKYNVTMIEGESTVSQKIQQSRKVYDYHDKVFLLMFRSLKQELYVLMALGKNDISALKQNIDALTKSSTEGLETLNSLPAFEGDNNLKNSCRTLLQFYKNEAANQLPAFTDYLIEQEKMEKITKTLKAKPQSKRTQQELDDYNQLLEKYNAKTAEINKLVTKISNEKNKVLKEWSSSSDKFIDSHVPKGKS